ncbi:MAG: alpha/beta hydrolase [Elusimicrobia bacterium]|nr:alpha/beta hydrolase [Elusimicrobiota bacterium]
MIFTPAPSSNSRKAGPVHLRDWGGPGIPLLLTHGMAAHTHWWDPVVPRWKGVFHAAALDFRGHGDSEWLGNDEAYVASHWVEDIETAREAMGWKRFVLVGHSMGARIALEYARRHGDRLRGVCAIDFLAEPHESSGRRREKVRGRAQPVYADEETMLGKFRLQPPGTLLDEAGLRELGRHGVRKTPEGWTWKFDWRSFTFPYGPVWAQLPLIEPAALIVRGDLSALMPREVMDKVVAAMPRARGLAIPGAFHHVPLDKPAELAAAIAAWAAELPA